MMNRRRRALMMMQASPEPGGIPITGLTWELEHNINGEGKTLKSGGYKYAACAGDSQRTNGAQSIGTITPQSRTIKFTGSATSGSYTINCFIHEYKNGTWQRRLRLYAGQTVSLASDTTTIAIAYAFGSTTGQIMTQAIVAASFGAEWV